MQNIDVKRLNNLEQTIHNKIMQASLEEKNLTITKAAQVCGCSISKISKFVQKLGFQNYKQYISWIYGEPVSPCDSSDEIERLKLLLNNFDLKLVDQFIDQLRCYNKIILFGYGPSFICVQYFEYKLRIVTNKVVIAVPDDVSLCNLVDETSLLIVFSTTGVFKSFLPIYHQTKEKGGEFLLVIEEYNTGLLHDFDNILFLTTSTQSEDLRPYEKSRSLFFIFIEQVIWRILQESRQQEGLDDMP